MAYAFDFTFQAFDLFSDASFQHQGYSSQQYQPLVRESRRCVELIAKGLLVTAVSHRVVSDKSTRLVCFTGLANTVLVTTPGQIPVTQADAGLHKVCGYNSVSPRNA